MVAGDNEIFRESDIAHNKLFVQNKTLTILQKTITAIKCFEYTKNIIIMYFDDVRFIVRFIFKTFVKEI